MSQPRFLADHDLNEHIIDGMRRREPAIVCIRVRDIGMHERPDREWMECVRQVSQRCRDVLPTS
jgi:hypothetical protein